MNASVLLSPSLHKRMAGSYETTYHQVCTALKAAGFRIVAEIDMAELLKKSESYMPPYKIVIVSDLDIAHRALTVAPDEATMLPCHVTVLQTQDDQIEIKITDAHVIWNTASVPYLKPIAEELNVRLGQVIGAL